jgi:hypothetical protein
MSIIERPLGRFEPTDFRHFLRYAISEETYPRYSVPIPIGINWYGAFDQVGVTLDSQGRAWFPKANELWGRVRGGHEICLKPPRRSDRLEWWRLFNQGTEGACVGFAFTRAKTLLERKVFNPWWLYREAKLVDEWPGEDYDGTSGRAAADVLQHQGHKLWKEGAPIRPGYGITVYRWARTVEDVAYALDPLTEGRSVLNAGYVIPLNSWGEGFPHESYMPLETLDRLLFREYGDAAIFTDR